MGDFISVIMPVILAEERNRFLYKTLDSIFNQSYKNFEVIIVHNGSDKKNKKNLGKYLSKIRYLYSPIANMGNARNLGIKIAKGDYIAFCDDDDLWLKDKLKLQLDAIKKYDVDFLASNAYFIRKGKIAKTSVFDEMKFFKNLKWNMHKNTLIQKKSLFNYFLKEDPFYPSTWFFKKELLIKNKFDINFFNGQDWDLLLGLSRKYKIGFINKRLVKIRKHDKNFSDDKNFDKRFSSYIGISDKWLNKNISKKSKKSIKNNLARFYFDRGYYYHHLNNDKNKSRKDYIKSLSYNLSLLTLKALIKTFID